MVPPTEKSVVLVYFVVVLCLDLLTVLWRRRGEDWETQYIAILCHHWMVFAHILFLFQLWPSCIPEKSTDRIRMELKVEDDYFSSQMICWHREIILKERKAPLWSATLLWKVNLKLFLMSKYVNTFTSFLRDPMANLFRLTRIIQMGEDLSGDLHQPLACSRVTCETCELLGTVSNLWLCKLFEIWESSCWGLVFSSGSAPTDLGIHICPLGKRHIPSNI